jgi:hypothetical protein
MADKFIDFAAVKEAVPIETAISFLGLKMKHGNGQYRAPCPTCESGGDRALVVTPSKAAFYCFAQKKGGDVIAFVAHIKKCSQREAGRMLMETYCTSSSTVRVPRSTSKADPPATDGTDLITNHPVIEALQLSQTVCQAIGIGVGTDGDMTERLAIPLRLPDGTLAGYLGIATDDVMVPLLLFSENLEQAVTKTEKKDETAKLHSFLRLVVNNG